MVFSPVPLFLLTHFQFNVVWIGLIFIKYYTNLLVFNVSSIDTGQSSCSVALIHAYTVCLGSIFGMLGIDGLKRSFCHLLCYEKLY